MGLDTRYIPSKYFQEGILDKTTGCPLAAGIVTFYRDSARTTPKEIFKISGSPPNYTYTSLGTSITLSGIGTFEDSFGNDLIPYFYPYDANGNLDLYYVTVESAGFVSQFTREGIPNLAERDVEGADVNNYIPNGQFLLHHDITEDLVVSREAGQITSDITAVSEGGWFFERSSGSTAKDFVFFDRFGSYTSTPDGSPRFAIRVKNEIPDGTDTKKVLRVTFRDVNKFATTTEFYTFSFVGKSDSGSPSNIDILQIKNYGTGGSAEDSPTLDTITLSTSYTTYNIPFIPGDNSGETIGIEEDDTISFAISFPTSFTFENSFDNFVLTDGDVALAAFPITTNAEFIRDSLNYTPAPGYKNQHIYLPKILGPEGEIYDTRHIGYYVPKSTEILEIGELWCDGSAFRVDSYSSDNIPFRRLYEKWAVNSLIGLSLYGTDITELIMLNFGGFPSAIYEIKAQTAGAPTPPADGAVPTGFTFNLITPNPLLMNITFLAASTLSGGEYFTYYNLLGQKIIVWYEVDGAGIRPVETAVAYIKIVLLGTDIASTVANKTSIGVNGFIIKIPDWRGYFMRITDDMGVGAAGRDPDAATRTDRGDTQAGNKVGTIQGQDVQPHPHPFTDNTVGNTSPTGPIPSGGATFGNVTVPNATAINTGTETRPINRYTNLAVLY